MKVKKSPMKVKKSPMKVKKSILQASYAFSYDNAYRRKSRLISRLEGEAEIFRERININKLSKDEYRDDRETLKIALDKSIASGAYSKFVTFHSQYMFNIHSFRQANQRFLPWHRVYLVKFEEMLNDVMKKEQPDKDYHIAFPYWDWEQDREIPELFHDFKPEMDVQVYFYDENDNPAGSELIKKLKVKRFPDPDLNNSLPREDLVNQIRQLPTFVEFTDALEGSPHNTVHRVIGGKNPAPDPNEPFDEVGAMRNPYISPLDPLFWCHHANIDRIWAGWQKKKLESGDIENMHPSNLTDEEKKMYPWFPGFTEEQTRFTESLNYRYDIL